MSWQSHAASPDYDVIIIGGGVAGLSCALILARSRVHTAVIDVPTTQGGYASGEIATHNFLTQDGASKVSILKKARDELKNYSSVGLLDLRVLKARKQLFSFSITCDDGREITSRYVVIATGNRFADEITKIPGFMDAFGYSIFTCPYCHAYEFTNRQLAVVHSGDTDLNMIKLLSRWTDNITYLANGHDWMDGIRAILREISPKNRIIDAPIAEFATENSVLKGIRCENGEFVPAEAAFLSSLKTAKEPLLVEIGVDFQEGSGLNRNVPKTDPVGRTNIERLLVIGDSRTSFSTLSGAAYEGILTGGYIVGDLVEEQFKSKVL